MTQGGYQIIIILPIKSKMAAAKKKKAIFNLLFTFFSHQEKVTKIASAHISLTYIHIFCSPYTVRSLQMTINLALV